MTKKQLRSIAKFNKQADRCVDGVLRGIFQGKKGAAPQLLGDIWNDMPLFLLDWGVNFWHSVAERAGDEHDNGYFTEYLEVLPILMKYAEITDPGPVKHISWMAELLVLIGSYYHAFSSSFCDGELEVRLGDTETEPIEVMYVATFWGQLQWTKYGKWLRANCEKRLQIQKVS